MNPLKVQAWHIYTNEDFTEEHGEYTKIDDYPRKVGDIVILEVYPGFDGDIQRQLNHMSHHDYPPEYLLLARVTRIVNDTWMDQFFCRVIMENDTLEPTKIEEKKT